MSVPPGDPAAVEGAARSFGSMASALDGDAGRVRSTASHMEAHWAGLAEASFAGAAGRQERATRAAAQAFRDASHALHGYASDLRAAQELARQADANAADAGAAVSRLQAAIGQAQAAMAQAPHAAAHHDAAALRALHNQLDRANGDVSTAAGQSSTAAQQAHAAAVRVAGQLEGIAARASAAGATSGGAAGRRLVQTAGPLDALAVLASTGAGANISGRGRKRGAGNSGVNWPSDLNLGRKVASHAGQVYGTLKVLPYMKDASIWQELAPGSPLADGQLSFGDLAWMNVLEHSPTWNNGLIGRGTAAVLSRLPGRAGALGGFLSDASRATPFFSKVGIGTGVLGVGLGGYSIYNDFAQHKSGDQLATDITGTAFSGASTAFFIAPTPITAGAVVVTGLAWGGAEAWQHRKAIGQAAEKAGKFVWDTSLPGVVWNNRAAIGHAFDSGVDLAKSGLQAAGSTLDSGLHTAEHVTGDVVDSGVGALKSGWHAATSWIP